MPLAKAVPNLDANGIDLLKGMLVYDPAGRVSGEYGNVAGSGKMRHGRTGTDHEFASLCVLSTLQPSEA